MKASLFLVGSAISAFLLLGQEASAQRLGSAPEILPVVEEETPVLTSNLPAPTNNRLERQKIPTMQIQATFSSGIDEDALFIRFCRRLAADNLKSCTKTVFLTSTTYNGNLGGIDGADAKCTSHAEAAELDGFYLAWLASTPQDDPETYFTRSELPYVTPDGQKVAESFADFTDGRLDSTLLVDENGRRIYYNGGFFAPLNSDGSFLPRPQTCSAYSSSSYRQRANVITGDTKTLSPNGLSPCSQPQRLLCVEQ